MEAEFTVVEKRRRLKSTQLGTVPRVVRPKPSKPPAVLIKVAEVETFKETLKTVQSAVDP